MKKIKFVIGSVIPKPEDNQNTDDIVPARFLKAITFADAASWAYADERTRDGEKHPFNDPKYSAGGILVAGENFGCGSSREHAPQALKKFGFGIAAIIAPSFSEIFAGNCASIGIVPVCVSKKAVQEMAESARTNPDRIYTITLDTQRVIYGARSVPFKMPEGMRKAFLDGSWDAMSVLQRNEEGIRRVESKLGYSSVRE